MQKAAASTKLSQDTDACNRFMERFSTDEERNTRIRELFEQSQPLIRLDRNIPQSSQFNYINLAKAGLIGGENPTEISAIKLAEILQKYFSAEEAIAPINALEKHKIYAVQEVGGFSLRCLQGIEQLRRAYQNWRGRIIMAKRAKLRGQKVDIPPSVHLQQNIIYWDFIPPQKDIEELVLNLRTLGILTMEVNPNTQQNSICYVTTNQGKSEKITLARDWENAIQVLEFSHCCQDRQNLEHQLAKKLETEKALS